MCQEFSAKHSFEPKKSVLSGCDWNQQPNGRWNNSWYDLNVRDVLATLAIGGGGGIDLLDFLSLSLISPTALTSVRIPSTKLRNPLAGT